MTNQQSTSTQSEQTQTNPNKPESLRVYLTLAVFGILYNQLIDAIEETDAHDMLVSLQVAVGVAVTVLFSLPFLGRRRAGQLFLSFLASGTPMIIGSLRRWQQRSAKAQGLINGHQTTDTGSIHTAA